LVGEAAHRAGVSTADEPQVARLAEALDARFEKDNVYLNQSVVTDEIRSEAAGKAASEVAALPLVRQALLLRQRGFRTTPGLVADGRDMGTVVFPDAVLKIYLTADPETRAERRYKQLIGKGMSASMAALLQDIKARDDRDSGRAVAPLQKSSDAILLDTTNLSIDDAVKQVLAHYKGVTQVP
jgi:cytidylate kinase